VHQRRPFLLVPVRRERACIQSTSLSSQGGKGAALPTFVLVVRDVLVSQTQGSVFALALAFSTNPHTGRTACTYNCFFKQYGGPACDSARILGITHPESQTRCGLDGLMRCDAMRMRCSQYNFTEAMLITSKSAHLGMHSPVLHYNDRRVSH
jgi:hypothetical protein